MVEPKKRSRKTAILVFLIALGTLFLATCVWTINRGSELDAPPAPWNVDGVFYDNLATNIQLGKGFVVDFEYADWRERFRAANDQPPTLNQYNWVLQYIGSGPTTLRSPGYPFALSLSYRVFGHDWQAARLIGCAFVSIGLALLITWSFLKWGYLAALIAMTTMILDYSIMQSAGLLASEALAILLLAVAFLLASRA